MSNGQKPVRWGVLSALLLSSAGKAYAYRPFISTDAAVADFHQLEIEMGYFNFSREGNKTTWQVPQAVFNYGVHDRMEAVAEFELDKTGGDSTQVVAPSVNLKWVAKEGFLQDKPGDSFAFETTLLLPSTLPNEGHLGFQEMGLWSHPLAGFIFHVNLGGGLEPDFTEGFWAWGTIAEHPVTKTIRIVGEITGLSPNGQTPDNSGLVGFIWQSPDPDFCLDIGARRGLTQSAADWQFTTGFSYGFIFPREKKSQ